MYHNIMLESPAKIYYKQDQLYIENEEKHHFPIEDLNALVIGNQNVTITARTLDALADNGTAIIVCGKNHQPSGVLIPFGAYSRRLPMINLQFKQSVPRKKRLWQQIVKRKIINQGKCLAFQNLSDEVTLLAGQVKSGDPTNIEGIAARRYFKILFGDDFSRGIDSIDNAMLNYGYAILRGCIARYLALYGLEPAVGIFHHSELNNFNLADDLIEVFRPAVDLLVHQSNTKGDELTPILKKKLVKVLQMDVLVKGMKQPVNYAIEQLVQSLMRYYKCEIDELDLPILLPVSMHAYE